MASISIKNLTVEFTIYGSNSRSLKKRLISQATGGRISSNTRDIVTVKAIDDLSMNIERGARLGLVGHNGAGKTTLLRSLAGIYKPTNGSIEIEGRVSTLINPAAGMDFESTGLENIYLRGYILGMSRTQIDSVIDDIADFTELGDFLSLPVKTYSAGMYSRLGFAISTAIHPDILLIDEGIGAGDANFQQKVIERTRDFISKAEIAIFASHDLAFLESIGARLIRLEQGRLIEES